MPPPTKPGTQLTPQQAKFITIRDLLKSKGAMANINAALPKHMTAERQIRIALTAINRSPKILDCTHESIMEALLTASQLGLEPNGRDAYLVPYKNRCQLIPGYMGFIQLAYRSGLVDNITARTVFQKDKFDVEFGSNEHLIHVPSRDDDPGPMIAAWAMCRFKDGGSKFIVLWPRDVARRKAASQATHRDDCPWLKYPEAMWAKSAVRELAKWIPQTPELAPLHRATAIEDRSEGVEQGYIDVDSVAVEDGEGPAPEPAESKSEQVAREMVKRNPQTPAAPPAAPPADRSAIEMRTVDYMAAIESADTAESLADIMGQAEIDTGLDAIARVELEKLAVKRRKELGG